MFGFCDSMCLIPFGLLPHTPSTQSVYPQVEAILGRGDKTVNPSARIGFMLADRHRVIREACLAYNIYDHHPAVVQLAHTLTDDLGRGRVSLTQLWKHIEAHPGDVDACVSTAEEALLVEKPLVIPPPKVRPTPTEWVYEWLKASPGGVELADEVGPSFIRENLSTRESLLLRPRLTIEDIEKTLGVRTLGTRRVVFELLSSLWAEADAQ